MDADTQAAIASLKDRVQRLEEEVIEYVTTERVLIAAGHVSKTVIDQAHEIVRSLP